MRNIDYLLGEMDPEKLARLLTRGWLCTTCPASGKCASGACCVEALTNWLEAVRDE